MKCCEILEDMEVEDFADEIINEGVLDYISDKASEGVAALANMFMNTDTGKAFAKKTLKNALNDNDALGPMLNMMPGKSKQEKIDALMEMPFVQKLLGFTPDQRKKVFANVANKAGANNNQISKMLNMMAPGIFNNDQMAPVLMMAMSAFKQ